MKTPRAVAHEILGVICSRSSHTAPCDRIAEVVANDRKECAASRPDITRSPFNRVTVAAFVRDRAHQYDETTGIFDALLQVAAQVDRGCVEDAFNHGELDDLLPAGRRSM